MDGEREEEKKREGSGYIEEGGVTIIIILSNRETDVRCYMCGPTVSVAAYSSHNFTTLLYYSVCVLNNGWIGRAMHAYEGGCWSQNLE